MLGMRESYEDWLTLARELIARGLGAPLLIVADGAPGLIKAIEQCWPASDRQRCCVHRARNLYAKLPERERERVKQAYWRALDDAISASDAKQRLEAQVAELDKRGYTAAANCLADDLDALVVHLRYPPRHRRRRRSTNLLERSLGEVKRRTKVMGRFPGEQSCLSLVWAVLDLLITHETNGIRFNQLDRQRLKPSTCVPLSEEISKVLGWLSRSNSDGGRSSSAWWRRVSLNQPMYSTTASRAGRGRQTRRDQLGLEAVDEALASALS